MAYGCQNEGKAREAYLTLQQSAHAGLTCRQVGFIVNPSESWLGASPDSLVDDPSCNQPDGLLEIKCPSFAGNGMSAQQYAVLKSSCLSLQLKTSHQYFYQIQVVMHVCQCQWCDFLVWSPEFMVLNRVFRDENLSCGVLAKLRSFFSHLLCQQTHLLVLMKAYHQK